MFFTKLTTDWFLECCGVRHKNRNREHVVCVNGLPNAAFIHEREVVFADTKGKSFLHKLTRRHILKMQGEHW